MVFFSLSARAFIAAVFFFLLVPWSSPASADCGAFSKPARWGGVSYERVKERVDAAHDGNWYSYISYWEIKLDALYDVVGREDAITVKMDGGPRRLEGDELKAFVEAVKRRIAITRCLAQREDEGGAEALNDFATAAGEEGVPGLSVTSACRDGNMVFKVANQGERWPRRAQFSIVNAANDAVYVARKLRMGEGQQITFRLPPGKHGGDAIAMQVEPAWDGARTERVVARCL